MALLSTLFKRCFQDLNLQGVWKHWLTESAFHDMDLQQNYATGISEVNLSQCVTNQALCHEGVWGSGCIDPHFLDLRTSCR
jgi:hypothetical protein